MSDNVKTLSIDASATRVQETRAIKVESNLKSAQELIETMTNQSDAITTERDQLRDEVKRLKDQLVKRTGQAKASRKALKRKKKLLERSEERFFLSTHDLMVRRAANAGLDYKPLIIEGMEDPVGRPYAPDQALVVSSALEAELSD